MPIFEYKCNKCNTKFEVLHKSSVNQKEVTCPDCKSTDNKKLFSTFAHTMSSGHSEPAGCSNGSCAYNVPSGGCGSGSCGIN